MPKKYRRKRVQDSSWKKARTVKKLFKKIKIMLFSLVVLAITGSFFWVASFFKLIKTPLTYATDSDIVRLNEWNGDKAINALAVTEKELGILRINPEVGSYTYLKIAVDMNFDQVDVAKARKAVMQKYAVTFDRYFIADLEGEKVVQLLFGDFRNAKSETSNYAKFFLNFQDNVKAIYSGIKTDLSLKEIFLVSNFLRNCDKGSTFLTDLSNSFDSGKFDYEYQQVLLSKIFREEGLTLLVLNGTEKPGLGGWGTRVVKNLGMNALDPLNSNEIEKNSRIIYKKSISKTAEALTRAFNIVSVVGEEDFEKYAPYAQRADILVIIGLDKIDEF